MEPNKVTLEQFHQYILQCQEMFEQEDEGAVEVEVTPETPLDVPLIPPFNKDIEKFHQALMELDCRFHDQFGCR